MECKVGTVKEIKNGHAVVLIERHSACSQCHAKGACTSADKDNQLIEIADYPIGISVGSKVKIVPTKGNTPLKAVLFAFVLPILLIAISTVVMNSRGVEERYMLMVYAGIIILYVGVLWLLRGYFDRSFRLRAELVD